MIWTRLFSLLLLLFSTLQSTAMSEAPTTPGKAAIASAHPLATEAGMRILQQGGNAFDAAIAVSSTLAVVEPYSSGLGGGGFWLLHNASKGTSIMLDGREKAPLKASRNMYLDSTGLPDPKLSLQGPLSAGIPGVPATYAWLAKKYGRLPLASSLAPAIKHASEGYIISDTYRLFAGFRLKALQADPEAARIFLLDNQVPPKGYRLKQPDLANTLRAIATKGKQGFYSGKIARQLVTGGQKAKGIWQMRDLADYQVIERKPITFTYRGYKVTSAAPPSSGGIALAEILNMLENYPQNQIKQLRNKHLIIETMRRAYADRAVHLGDPDFYPVPIKKLTSKHYARQLTTSIIPNKATASHQLQTKPADKKKGTDTTHFSIIDKFGNKVAATLSINYPFGACFVPKGTGVLLNDEMDDFSAKPGQPNAYGLVGAEANAIQPGKRPLSSMSPTFIENNERIAIIGTPGGSRIITMVLLGALGFIDGLSAKEIVSTKRFHHQYLPDKIVYETGAFSPQEVEHLQKLGHVLEEKPSPYGGAGAYGNMHIVIWNKQTGSLSAASDPRGHGLAKVQ